MSPPRLAGIDHIVLSVADIAQTAAFFERAIGAQVVSFGQGRTALMIGPAKINLHSADAPFAPHARAPIPGAGDICLLCDTPIAEIAAHLGAQGIAIEDGPVERSGARGPILSLYIRDPDGNLIELAQPLAPPA